MAESLLVADELPERHRAVLREALALFAEKGYAGASLRELARRVGVRQPSLYHYFRSKEELVEQILQHVGIDLFRGGPGLPPGTRLEDVPALLTHVVLYLYEQTDWPLFVRFLFTISLAEPRFAPRLRELFTERAEEGMGLLMRPFVERGEIDGDDARHLVRMVINAVALSELEASVLYPGEEPAVDMHAFAAFVGGTARAWLLSRERP